MSNKNLYTFHEILGIKLGASKEEIKRAYKLKAKQYHPDIHLNPIEKKEAEQKFKLLKEAYDYLMSIEDYYDSVNYWNSTESFSNFYNSEINDDYDDFINKKKNNFENLEKRAIKFIEEEIKKRKINILYVYKQIKENKSIFKWDINEYDTKTLNDFIVKEALYRRMVRNSNEYKGFVNNFNFYNNMNIYATLKIDRSYSKTKFEENIKYKIKSICRKCNGCGCNKCDHGIIEESITTYINIPIKNSKKYYEIDNAGNQSPLGNGKLIITVVNSNLKNETYRIRFKNQFVVLMYPLFDFNDLLIEKIKWLINLVISHKHISALYFLILILLIIIICLAILL